MSKATEIKMYKTMVKPAVFFGSETWAVTERNMKRMGTWRETLRRVHGPVVELGIWRVRTDQELREIYKDLDIIADIKKMRFEWLGSVERMDQGRRDKKAVEIKRERSSRKGKHRLRWLESV